MSIDKRNTWIERVKQKNITPDKVEQAYKTLIMAAIMILIAITVIYVIIAFVMGVF